MSKWSALFKIFAAVIQLSSQHLSILSMINNLKAKSLHDTILACFEISHYASDHNEFKNPCLCQDEADFNLSLYNGSVWPSLSRCTHYCSVFYPLLSEDLYSYSLISISICMFAFVQVDLDNLPIKTTALEKYVPEHFFCLAPLSLSWDPLRFDHSN